MEAGRMRRAWWQGGVWERQRQGGGGGGDSGGGEEVEALTATLAARRWRRWQRQHNFFLEVRFLRFLGVYISTFSNRNGYSKFQLLKLSFKNPVTDYLATYSIFLSLFLKV